MEKATLRRISGPWLWGALACVFALVVSALAVVCSLGNEGDAILDGVTVDQISVGGMSREQAEAHLERLLLPRYRETHILFSAEDALVAELTCAGIGATPDLETAVESAYAVGRFGGDGWVDAFRRGWFRLFGEKSVNIDPAIYIDEEQLVKALPPAPQNARYDAAADQVVEGGIGVTVDAKKLAQLLGELPLGESLAFPVEVVEPEVTAEQLRAVLFRDELSTYTTTVSGSAARKENVRLSAAAIDGLVLESGGEFDFNAVVGERTAARGYGAAPAYVNGETVDSIGGGICQTSSTLYLAALLADLKIVERSAHRYVSGYIPLGMDATVSWGGPEFRFRNDTAYPIRLSAKMENGQLTVSIRGTKLDDSYVEMTYEVLDTQGYQTQYRESSALSPGETRQVQSGYTGRTVQTYRNVYDGAGNLLRATPEARSVYRSRDQILLVGAKATTVEKPVEEPAPEEQNPPETEGPTPEETPPAEEQPASSQTEVPDDPLPLRLREDFTG